MTRCLELDECGGISFSHMYWGDRKSSGPHRGYGYQLRKGPLVDTGRYFEASWVRRETPLT